MLDLNTQNTYLQAAAQKAQNSGLSAGNTGHAAQNTAHHNTADTKGSDRPVFKMKSHDRMGGSVPVWETRKTSLDKTEGRFADALSGRTDSFDPAMAFAGSSQDKISQTEEPFSFGDIVDMVNPLQHIPVIGNIYREITGDEMRSSSRIFGGAVFGGGVGAVGGFADAISENETGKDISEHAMSALTGKDKAAKAEHGNAAARTAQDETTKHQPQSLKQDAAYTPLPDSVFQEIAMTAAPTTKLAERLNSLDVGGTPDSAATTGAPSQDSITQDTITQALTNRAATPPHQHDGQNNARTAGRESAAYDDMNFYGGLFTNSATTPIADGKSLSPYNRVATAQPQNTAQQVEKQAAGGRTAGNTILHKDDIAVMPNTATREPIRQVSISEMPAPLFRDYFALNQ